MRGVCFLSFQKVLRFYANGVGLIICRILLRPILVSTFIYLILLSLRGRCGTTDGLATILLYLVLFSAYFNLLAVHTCPLIDHCLSASSSARFFFFFSLFPAGKRIFAKAEDIEIDLITLVSIFWPWSEAGGCLDLSTNTFFMYAVRESQCYM